MNPSISSQAATAAQEGQDLYNRFRGTAATASGQYTSANQQVQDTNAQLGKETAYMQGEGSGQNVYNAQLDKQKSAAGFSDQQLSDANKSLFAINGALNGANTQFNQPGGVGAYGMSAPALASYESSILNPLQTGTANANTEVGALNAELGTLETGASQATSAQVQTEQNSVDALNKQVANYQQIANNALQQMQFYDNLASQQGTLNANQQQAYAQATQAYAAAKQAEAQTSQILLQNQQIKAAMGTSTPAASPATPVPNKTASAPKPNAAAGGNNSLLSEFFSNPSAAGSRIGNDIGGAGSSLVNWAANRLKSNAAIFRGI